MPQRIGDRGRCANIETTQSKSIEAEVTNHRAEVSDSPFQAEILDVSVGAGHPANVVADHPPSKTDQSVGDLLDVRKPEAIAGRLAEDV